jgi:hypothetical protein
MKRLAAAIAVVLTFAACQDATEPEERPVGPSAKPLAPLPQTSSISTTAGRSWVSPTPTSARSRSTSFSGRKAP